MKRVSSFTNTPFYFIATPIGNLQELTPRAVTALEAADFVCCEDSRVTGNLLSLLKIKKPLIPVHKFNEVSKVDQIIHRILNGEHGVFVSDAGYPLISDPGSPLVKSLLEHNIAISVINGASALLPALVGSGFDTSSFYFHGFLKGKDNEVKQALFLLSTRPETLIFYEAPHRLNKTLLTLHETLGDRPIAIARELTKLHEEYIYATLAELALNPLPVLKGEIVIVIEGSPQKEIHSDFDFNIEINKLIAAGYSLKESTKILSIIYNIPKNKLYEDYIKASNL